MNIALLLSGGTGSRLGTDIPKQYMKVKGWPVIAYSFEQLALHEQIDAIWIVADAAWQEMLSHTLSRLDSGQKLRGFSRPGESRQLSIWQGLEDVRKSARDTDTVLIHDAARPCLTGEMISKCLQAAKGHDGAIPVLPMKDTVYASMDSRKIHALLDRSTIFAGQAPEVFTLGKYLAANRRLLPEKIRKINGSTEPAILAGLDVAMFPGDEENFKITTRADLARFERIVWERSRREEMGEGPEDDRENI